MDLVDELIKSLEIPSAPVTTPASTGVPKWLKPDHGWLKLNCDGAVDMNAERAGVGVVARDHTGAYVVPECRRYEHITDPSTPELLACRDVVMVAKERGWTHIVVETDCQLLVTAWEKNEGHRPASNQVLREMKAIVSNFQGFMFSFSRREANKAAHAGARAALSVISSVVTYEQIPGFLVEPVQSDILSLME
jgi:ribonuclease HI